MGARVVQHSRLAARTSWALWGLLALSATVLLAIIIAVSVSNAKMSRRIIALEGSVVNFSSSVKAELQAGRATDQEIQGEINKLKVSTLTTESQLSLVGRAVTAVNELDTLKSMVFQVNCILHRDGLLNDDHCSRSYYFVCEARAG